MNRPLFLGVIFLESTSSSKPPLGLSFGVKNLCGKSENSEIDCCNRTTEQLCYNAAIAWEGWLSPV